MYPASKNRGAGRRSSAGYPIRNTVLLHIPDREFYALERHFEFQMLNKAVCLLHAQETIPAVYFLNRGVASMVVDSEDGRSVEVGISGREDVIGLPLIAGLDRTGYAAIMQVPGDAYRVAARTMLRLLPCLPEFRHILLRHLAIRLVLVAQNGACNRLHDVKQRLARWLLVTRDRADSDVIPTTHNFLATLVGTDRPTVTSAVGELEHAGIIGRARASISILDRRRLQHCACECYGVYRRYNRELGLA